MHHLSCGISREGITSPLPSLLTSFRQPHRVHSPPGSPCPAYVTSSQSSSSFSPYITTVGLYIVSQKKKANTIQYNAIQYSFNTRKPSYRWQTRATRKPAKNCSNSTCLQRCRGQYWPIFIRLAVVESEICEIPRNSLKIQTYGVQGHPRSSILVSIESPCTTSY